MLSKVGQWWRLSIYLRPHGSTNWIRTGYELDFEKTCLVVRLPKLFNFPLSKAMFHQFLSKSAARDFKHNISFQGGKSILNSY